MTSPDDEHLGEGGTEEEEPKLGREKKPPRPPRDLLENLMIARYGWGKLVGRSRIQITLADIVVLECLRRWPEGLVVGPALKGRLLQLLTADPQSQKNFTYLRLYPWKERTTHTALARLVSQQLVRCFALPSGKKLVRISDKSLGQFAKAPATSLRTPRPGEIPLAFRLNIERGLPPSDD